MFAVGISGPASHRGAAFTLIRRRRWLLIPIVLVTAILPDGKPPRGEASAEASAEAPLAAWPSGSISEAPFGG